MRRSLMTMVATGLLTLTTGCVEMQRICSGQEMITMKEKGLTADEIDNMCTAYKVKEESIKAVADVVKAMATARSQSSATVPNSPSVPTAFSNNSAAYCATQYGSCPLGTRAPGGLVCQCQTPYGPIPGVTQ